MTKGAAAAVAFGLGAVVGAMIAWKYAKTKYENIAREEIESVKEAFSRRSRHEEETMTADNVEEDTISHEEMAKRREEESEYSKLIKRLKYAPETMDDEENDESSVQPYVISPDDFGDQDGYEREFLTYYADNVLADECDEKISDENLIEMIGPESLKHMGEYAADMVHVRNDVLRTDYEIIADLRNYDDVPRTPMFNYLLEDET